MKTARALFSTLLLLSCAANASGGGDGTRGGESVRVHGRPELRDLVERSNCHWVSGDEMIAQTPYVKTIFSNISRIDWLFALKLQSEMRHLDYCLTGPLVRVPTEDPDGLTAVVTVNTRQLAIRLDDSVYIDMGQFRAGGPVGMTDRTRGYTLVHETMHSFVPSDAQMRNNKIRSMTKSVEDTETHRIVTRAQFVLQLERNEVQYDASLMDQAEPVRAQVEFAYLDYPEQVRRLANISNKKAFFESFSQIPTAVFPAATPPSVMSFVDEAIAYDDVAAIDMLARDPALTDSVVSQVYVSKVPHPRLGAWMKSQGTIEKMAARLLGQLAGRAVSVVQGHVVVSNQNLLASSQDSVKVTQPAILNLHAIDAVSGSAPQLLFYVTLIQDALVKGDVGNAARLTFANPEFYRAFSLSAVDAQIANVTGTSDKERRLAQEKADVMTVAFWQYANAILMKAAPDAWTDLKSQIDFGRLGYEF